MLQAVQRDSLYQLTLPLVFLGTVRLGKEEGVGLWGLGLTAGFERVAYGHGAQAQTGIGGRGLSRDQPGQLPRANLPG